MTVGGVPYAGVTTSDHCDRSDAADAMSGTEQRLSPITIERDAPIEDPDGATPSNENALYGRPRGSAFFHFPTFPELRHQR